MNGFLSRLGIISAAFVVVWACAAAAADATLSSANAKTYHVWEKVEIVFVAKAKYENPYTDVTVWVDLKGPGFDKRCYGFWDGGDTFRVRVAATAPGTWTWRSGSQPADPGLDGVSGSFTAVEWTEAQKAENPCRRGMIRPSANGHAFQYADGTPFPADRRHLVGDADVSVPLARRRHAPSHRAGGRLQGVRRLSAESRSSTASPSWRRCRTGPTTTSRRS